MFTLFGAGKPDFTHLSASCHRILPLFFFLLAHPAVLMQTLAQTTYYVAATGNDASNGSANAPFRSLTKASSLLLQPGDSVLFRRGDTFRGTLTVRRSGSVTRPLVFAAYGSGPKPVIAGSVPVTNWTAAGGNVWQASCPSCGSVVTGVYKNGGAQPLARYPNADAPNKGYLTIRAHTEKYQIFSQENLPSNIDWKGGEVVMRPTQWIIDRAVIDAQYGNALNLFNYSTYFPADGWGYFIQNHPAALDQNGEWYYNPVNKSIKLYSSTANPNSQAITATTQSRGIDIATSSHIVLQNLEITQTLNEGVYAENVTGLTILNNDITNSGEDGLIIKGTGSGLLLENNRIVEVNNNGIYTSAYQNVTIKNNLLRRIGVQPGRGKSGDGQYNGLQSNANANVLIERNRIDSVGYNGLSFWNNTLIRHNIISNYCLTKSDGGAIYAWNYPKAPMTNVRILSNIVYNGLGAPEGSFRQEYSGANGIFLDECNENVEIRNNTVFNNHQWGIFLHGSHTITLTDNTVFDNGACQLVVYHNNGRCPVRNDVIKRNIFVSKTASQLVAQYEAYNGDLQLYGVIDSNYYARPFNEEAAIRGYNSGQGSNFNLRDWQTYSGGYDLHTKNSPIRYVENRADGAGGTNIVNSHFGQNSDGWELVYSRYGNAEVTHDNTDRLDGGSLRLSFPVPSGNPGSYAQAVRRFGSVRKGKSYVLRFDAVSTANIPLLVHLRRYGPPFTDYGRRYTVPLSPDRKSYELVFVAQDNDPDAIIMMQTEAEGTVIWVDNVRLQEDVPILNNPDEFIKLYYNPTLADSTVMLPPGTYRDVTNALYTNSLVLKPFSSIILLRESQTVSPADLSLSLWTDKRVVPVNEPVVFRLRVRNESDTPASLARWTYRLPANSEFVMPDGQTYTDNVLTGTVSGLLPGADTTFTFTVKPTAAGVFRTAAQLTTATSPDPDSAPNTGLWDGEDDVATVELRVGQSAAPVFESPNPVQRLLPAALTNQPPPDPAKADLSLQLTVSRRAVVVGDTITYTLRVTNSGGLAAGGVDVQNQLPDGLELADAPNWTVAGQLLTTTLPPIAAGATVSASFQVRVKLVGEWTSRAQISAANVPDPDSTPGNGFATGEDDEAQVGVRGR